MQYKIPKIIHTRNYYYHWLDIIDFSPVNIYNIIIPISSKQRDFYFIKNNFLKEGFEDNNIFLNDNSIIYDYQIDIYGFREEVHIDKILDFNKQPESFFSHNRIGESSEQSLFGFSRNINEIFSVYLQGALNKGSIDLDYNEKELQQGFVKTKYMSSNYSISTFLYHNFNREDLSDSTKQTSTIDIGNINIANNLFSLDYYYSSRYNMLDSSFENKKHIFLVNYSPFTHGRSHLDIFSKVSILNNQTNFYSFGINYSLEIFPLFQIFVKGKVKSDSSFMFETSFLHRLNSKRAIYFSMFWKRFSYEMDIPLSIENPYEWKRIYIGTKFYSKKLKFDLAAGLSINEVNYDSLLNNSDTLSTYIIGGVNINYNIFENSNLYFNLYKNTDYSSYLFLSQKLFYFKDDLSLEFIPGVMFEDKENYLPQLLIKASILSFQAHWRVSYLDNNYIYDYGLFWKLVN